jgi:phosphoserine aminotransferase
VARTKNFNAGPAALPIAALELAQRERRSYMSAVFNLPSVALENEFVAAAIKAGLVGQGHRSVGGIRVSLYNAVEIEWVRALVAFMGASTKRSDASRHPDADERPTVLVARSARTICPARVRRLVGLRVPPAANGIRVSSQRTDSG